jgi:hypothetical protein
VEKEFGHRTGIAGSSNLYAVRMFQLWAIYEAADEIFPAGDRGQVRNLARRGRETVKRIRDAHAPLPYTVLAWEAILTAMGCARADSPSPAEIAEARVLLRKACDKDVMGPEEEKAPTQKEKNDIRELGKRCAELLSELGGPDSR